MHAIFSVYMQLMLDAWAKKMDSLDNFQSSSQTNIYFSFNYYYFKKGY